MVPRRTSCPLLSRWGSGASAIKFCALGKRSLLDPARIELVETSSSKDSSRQEYLIAFSSISA